MKANMSKKETPPCPDYTHQLPKKLADFLHQRQDVKYNKFEAFRYLLEMQASASAESELVPIISGVASCV